MTPTLKELARMIGATGWQGIASLTLRWGGQGSHYSRNRER